MKCQRCQKREAAVIIKQNINGIEKEYKICQTCIEELGFNASFGFDLDNFLGGGILFPKIQPGAHHLGLSGTYNSGVFVPNKQEVKVCKHCNTSLEDIRKKGKLGCNYCYEAFEDQLGQVFRRVQSGEKHRGRPIAESKEKNEINNLFLQNEKLQQQIKEAVEREDYESAAKYKTQIIINKQKIDELENAIRTEISSNQKEKRILNKEKKIHEIEIHDHELKDKNTNTNSINNININNENADNAITNNTDKSDNAITNNTDRTNNANANNSITNKTGKTNNAKSDNAITNNTDKINNSKSDNAITNNTDKPNNAKSDNTITNNTDRTNNANANNSITNKTGKTNNAKTDNAITNNISKTDNANASNVINNKTTNTIKNKNASPTGKKKDVGNDDIPKDLESKAKKTRSKKAKDEKGENL